MRGLHDWLLDSWYGGTRRAAWLLPLAWLFVAVLTLRRGLYAAGLLRRYRSPHPVIVVGNVTVGGTGKTPLIAWLSQQLVERGLRPGIVSRGYGRASTQVRRVAASDTAAEVGDEPLLLARRPGVAVAVGADRPAAVRLLEPDCDVILSDDGLQHLALRRDAELVVVDGSRGLGNGWVLPAGPLREPASRLERVAAVVVNGEGFDRPGALQMRLAPLRFVGVASGEVRPPQAFLGKRVHAVAGIGHPERFFRTLSDLGIEVDRHPLPDHAVPTARDLEFGDGAPVLMTEKDAVKCAGLAGPLHFYLEVAALFEPDDAVRLLEVVESVCRKRPPSKLET